MKAFSFFLILATLGSCGIPSEKKSNAESSRLDYNGVRLRYPGDWSVAEKSAEDDVFFISLEKDGLHNWEQFNLTWTDDSLDLEGWIDVFVEDFRSRKHFKKLKIGDVEETEFLENPAKSLDYSTTAIGDKLSGKIIVFYHNNKTYCVVSHGEVERMKKERTDFDRIVESMSFDNYEGLEAFK